MTVLATTAARAATCQRLKSLADETRLTIVSLLRDGERCVCELTEALEIPQPLLSFHLKTLKEAGLVTDRREGRWAYYSLNVGALRDLQIFLGTITVRSKEPTTKPRRCT